MTNDKELIKKMTGLDIGKVWLKNSKINSELYDDEQILFDTRRGNFHMLPKDTLVVEKAIQGIKNKRIKILNVLEKRIEAGYKINKRYGNGKSEALKRTGMINAFDYIRVESDAGEKYDLMFSRFFISDDNSLNCRLCSYQFAFFGKEICSYQLYPNSYEAGKKCDLDLECEYYNPSTNYTIEDDSDINVVVEEFWKYIKSKKKELYIIKKSSLQSPHLLKLNRITKHLEYYRLSTDNAILHDYYPIRKDFDSSDYLMYEKEKEFPCIWGGGDTPPPEGIFQIEKVSEAHEEYVSGYYTGHDKVKFFGYLVVFEDYFIHSNLYTEEATQDTFEQMKHINGAEEHSSGCIRLTQEDLDWLVKNVEVGTTVVM